MQGENVGERQPADCKENSIKGSGKRGTAEGNWTTGETIIVRNKKSLLIVCIKTIQTLHFHLINQTTYLLSLLYASWDTYGLLYI